MQINKITLENLGLYRGKKVFDLRPQTKDQKPIILFGGKNGAGKTTFLNSIRLGLYGKRSLGTVVSKAEYNDYLIQKIHRHPDSVYQARTASITIDFDFVAQGEKINYEIKRFWENRNGKAIEEVSILKDGRRMDDIDSEYWDSFISDIIPERLSQLFFFDGEKIQDIADDIKGNSAIAEAIQSLLGLDIVDRLQADLKVYISREARQVSNKDDRKEIDFLEQEIQIKEDLESKLVEEQILLNTEIDIAKSELGALEDELKAKGADFSKNRDKTQKRIIELETMISESENSIYAECQNLFPLALCPNIVNKLKKQLNTEQESKKAEILSKELQSIEADLLKKLSSISNDEVISAISTEFAKRIPSDASDEVIHNLSESESQRYISTLDLAQSSSCEAISGSSSKMERFTNELRLLKKSLNQAPDESLLEETYEALQENAQKRGELQTKLRINEEDLRKNTNELEQLKRNLSKLLDKQKEYADHFKRAEQISVIDKALNEYNEKLTEIKIANLKSEVVKSFNDIARKSGFVKDVTIDKKTFEVRLIDEKGQEIPKEDLSSGEKQIFAISFLWALAKTSGRPLPVIVDTPLGRLDSEHRLNLIENYFPKASHQVILFSTDTEVDEHLYSKLEPSISHCYHLRFDKEVYETIPEEEYFWKEELVHA